jgi:hypothetical protein
VERPAGLIKRGKKHKCFLEASLIEVENDLVGANIQNQYKLLQDIFIIKLGWKWLPVPTH